MFRTAAIKNSKRPIKNRILDRSIPECSVQRPDERTLPYCEVVPEQVLSDVRYISLSDEHQGAFWRLMFHVVAPAMGMVVRHPGMIALKLGISEEVWTELEAVLLNVGLLVITKNGIYLLQHEFREQYLQTLDINNAKRHP